MVFTFYVPFVTVYSGPSTNFKYAVFRGLGATQLVLGGLLSLLGLIQCAFSDEDRSISLVSGSVIIWMPLFVSKQLLTLRLNFVTTSLLLRTQAVGSGLVGVLFSRKRFWEVECLVSARSD